MSIQPKNLDQKVAILLDELDKLPRPEAIRKMTQFVMNEMEWQEREFILDNHDLEMIRSYAVKTISDFPIQRMKEYGFENGYGADNERMRTMCWVEATISFLRSKQLIPFVIDFKKKGRKV